MEVAELKDDEVFITSAVKYLPKGYITPKPRDIEHGRTHLFEQLNAIVPKFVVLLGNVAAIAVLGEKFSIAKVHGTFIDRGGVTYFLSYHPAAPLYAPKLLAELKDDFIKLKQRINHETNN
jgi:DNA polymerase